MNTQTKSRCRLSQVLKEIEPILRSGQIINAEVKKWASITFSGTRVELMIGWDDAAHADLFAKEIGDYGYAIPGQLVADATCGNANVVAGVSFLDATFLLLDDA